MREFHLEMAAFRIGALATYDLRGEILEVEKPFTPRGFDWNL